jgi:WD domain, G-beta repeat.
MIISPSIYQQTDKRSKSMSAKLLKKRIEKTSKEVKNKPIKLSKNVHKMKKELKSDFNLLLEAHTDLVCCVIVTCDNKYIISGSKDKTIRI